MALSSKQINKAGEMIRNGNESQAIELLNQWRSSHMLPLKNIRAIVDARLKKLNIECTVGQRLKRMTSIIHKIRRFPDMSVSKMQDVGGLRIIVPRIADVDKVHEALIKKSKHQIIVPPKDYIKNPKADGYRSLHQVFKYQSPQNDEFNNMRIEVQIRTKLQHAWATAVETLEVIDKVSYKSGDGQEAECEFFRIASALFSLKENSPVLEECRQLTKEDLTGRLKEIDEKQQILNRLKGLSTLKASVSLKSKSDVYYVLQLSADEQKEFSIKVIPFDDEEQAALHYDMLENLARGDPSKSVVLVRSKNLKELKKAYPNYFLDTMYFVRTLEELAQGTEK